MSAAVSILIDLLFIAIGSLALNSYAGELTNGDKRSWLKEGVIWANLVLGGACLGIDLFLLKST